MSPDEAQPSADHERPGGNIELAIAASFIISFLGAAGFAALYVTGNRTQLAGLCVFVAAGGLALGLGLWARWFMPNGPDVEHRPQLRSEDEERREFLADFQRGDRPFTRRRLLTRLLGAGVIGGVLAALFPFKSLGPNPGSALAHTAWRPGRRLVTQDGAPVHPSDLEVGSALTVFPEGSKSPGDSQTVLVNYGAAPFRPRRGREQWTVDNLVAYSKVCTHAGCPVGLYDAVNHQLMCPCHQSLFDVLDGARPVFGPATRSLPQLPLEVDTAGFLAARRDYTEPVGPGYWHRK